MAGTHSVVPLLASCTLHALQAQRAQSRPMRASSLRICKGPPVPAAMSNAARPATPANALAGPTSGLIRGAMGQVSTPTPARLPPARQWPHTMLVLSTASRAEPGTAALKQRCPHAGSRSAHTQAHAGDLCGCMLVIHANRLCKHVLSYTQIVKAHAAGTAAPALWQAAPTTQHRRALESCYVIVM